MKATMRVLLLAAMVGYAAAGVCKPETCGKGIYEKLLAAKLPTKGFTDGDAATYAYMIWHDWTNNAGTTNVDGVTTGIGEYCKTTIASFKDGTWTKADVVKCFNDAKKADYDAGVKLWSDKTKGYLAALAYQLAPKSLFYGLYTDAVAKEFNADILKKAINVYYIFGSVYPNWDALGATCQAAIIKAGKYTDGTSDIAISIADNADAIIAAWDAACKEDGWTASKALATYFGASELTRRRLGDADKATTAAGAKAAVVKANTKAKAVTTAVTKAAAGKKSPAAALSALVAFIALML